MNRLIFIAALAACGAAAAQTGSKVGAYDLRVGPKQQPWTSLFNGKDLAGWKGYRTDHVPAGWSVQGGCLVRDPKGEHGDIVTVGAYGDFELSLEWAIAEAGNSGIMFRSTEDHDYPWETGPEMQVLDDAKHPDGRNDKTSAGSNYALYAPVGKRLKPVGQFNEARIVAKGPHVEYWLNGARVVQYDIGSPEWTALVKGSKFASMPDYARRASGHIVLQDHGDVVRYRNIKIRKL